MKRLPSLARVRTYTNKTLCGFPLTSSTPFQTQTVIQTDRGPDPSESSQTSERENRETINSRQTGENEMDLCWEADDEQEEDGEGMTSDRQRGEKKKIRGGGRQRRTSEPCETGDPSLKVTGDFPECSQVVIMAGVCSAQGTVAIFTYDDLPNAGEGLDVFERAEGVIGLMHEHIRQLKRNAEERKEALFRELLDIIYKDYANHLHASVWSYRARLTETFDQVKHPERAKSEAGELKSKLENYLKRAKEAKEGKKK